MKPISLSSRLLTGSHLLRGVDTDIRDEHRLTDWVRFQLDDRVFVAVEDPDDGYRSSLDHIEAVDEEIVNRFARAVRVKGVVRKETKTQWGSEQCDILDLVNERTGKVILSVGTNNTDDYYPWFVAEFHPENV